MNWLMKIWAAIVSFFKAASKSVKAPTKVTYTNDWVGLIKAYVNYDKTANHFKVASLAQWILESGRGTSDLALQHLNFGGLKWRPEMKGYATPVLIKVPSESEPVEFCKFTSVEAFIAGYWQFISRAPYIGWERYETAESYLQHIFNSGYAVDTGYLQKTISLTDESRKLLNQYGATVEEPERPSEPITGNGYTIPTIKELPSDIRFDNQGNYRTPTGFAKGLIVHYTVGWRTPQGAINTARYLASKGLGCLVMDEEGTIWVPQNWNWQKQWDDNAGVSSWRGVSSISRYCYGMEICCWGKLSDKSKPHAGTTRISGAKDNIKAGEYEAYTPEQEESLINFCLWQLDTNPEFSIDWIVGHDEIAPTRKSDPGASLSLTMPAFRNMLSAKLKG